MATLKSILPRPVRRALADWSLRAASYWYDKAEWGSIFGGQPTQSGLTVTPDSALTLTSAYACINVVSTDFAGLPCKIFRRRRDGLGADEVRDTELAGVLGVTPDGETTPMRARQALMGHVLGWGNSYQEIETNRNGRVIGLHLLDPRTVPEREPKSKRLQYRLTTGGTLAPTKVLHLAGLGFDGLKGYSPVEQAREAIALGKAAELFGAGFFGRGARPSGVITTPQVLKESALKNLRASFEALHAGHQNAGRVAILEQGMEYKPISLSPEDAQFLQTRQFQTLEICRIYRVPPHKIADLSEAHLSNIEAANIDYLSTVLAPWCEQYEQVANLRLLTADERAQGYYIEHVLAALLRGDMRARAEFYRSLEQLGAISPNEIRARENLNPIGEQGDVYLAPLNMGPLDRIAAGETIKAKSEPAPAGQQNGGATDAS